MKPILTPPLFADAHHRRDHDAMIERWSAARMWLRKNGRVERRAAPAVPPVIARIARRRAA